MATIEVAPAQNVLQVEEPIQVEETKIENVVTTIPQTETQTKTPEDVKEETKEIDEVPETKLEEAITPETETKDESSEEIEKIEELSIVVEKKIEEPSIVIDEKIEETPSVNNEKTKKEILPKEIIDTSVDTVTEKTSIEETEVVHESEVEILNNAVKEENKSIEA